jgi:leucyl aminopeptidase
MPVELNDAALDGARVVRMVSPGDLGMLELPVRAWAEANGFTARPGEALMLPAPDGSLAGALFGKGEEGLDAGSLARLLPAGDWRLAGASDPGLAALGLLLGGYGFTRYRSKTTPLLRLECPSGVDGAHLRRVAESVFLARDLVNTPAGDLGPEQLEAAVRRLGEAHGAAVTTIAGDDLIAGNFPMIHAVGRAAAQAPRLVDLRWGPEGAPRVTLVGKGVCFDTGGLDIKPSSGMLLMKKDMGGAANVLGLASMLMAARLPIRLRVLVPAVENSVSAASFRPGDVLRSRKGPTVEIGNTDAEGRLVLADALALADEEAPDLLVDMATLTGAARVALGPDVPPFYTHDDGLAADLAQAAAAVEDPLWRMPLWKPYAAKLSSKVADLNNVTADGFAGSVTAALFLDRFVEKAGSWAHFDIFAWSPADKPSCPAGGEAQGIRALERLLARRYDSR